MAPFPDGPGSEPGSLCSRGKETGRSPESEKRAQGVEKAPRNGRKPPTQVQSFLLPQFYFQDVYSLPLLTQTGHGWTAPQSHRQRGKNWEEEDPGRTAQAQRHESRSVRVFTICSPPQKYTLLCLSMRRYERIKSNGIQVGYVELTHTYMYF